MPHPIPDSEQRWVGRVNLPPGLFVTGTDTGVGKTYVTALIARQLTAEGAAVGVYKPACSGSVIGPDGSPAWADVDELYQAVGGRFDPERICPQRFEAPLAPPVAARLEGRTVDAGLLCEGAAWWRGRVELLLVEGVGGLLCPLTETETVAELAADLGLPLLIVARAGLGTINHTLLTVEAARRRGLTVAGIVLSQSRPNETGPAVETNPAEIATRCDAPLLGTVPYGSDGCLLHQGRSVRMDWRGLAARRRTDF